MNQSAAIHASLQIPNHKLFMAEQQVIHLTRRLEKSKTGRHRDDILFAKTAKRLTLARAGLKALTRENDALRLQLATMIAEREADR